MSLIFKALKHNQPDRTGDGRKTESPRANVYSLRKLFSSFPAMLTVAALIFGFGVLAAQGVQLLSDRKPPAVSEPLPAAWTSEAAQGAPVENQVVPETPPAPADPDNLPLDQLPAGSGNKAGAVDDGGPESTIVTQFFPPEPVAGTQTEDANSPAIPVRNSGTDNGMRHPPAYSTDTGVMPERLSGQQTGHQKMASVSAPATQRASNREDFQTTRKNVAGRPAASTTAISDQIGNTELDFPGKGRARSHLHVARLAERVVGAIQARDDDLTRDLLSQLVDIKGSDHLFVLKLKAYWYMQQGNTDKARTVLAQVLSRLPNDREAGLNLAVIDIQEGRTASARRRLEHMRRLYPEDAAAVDYLSQLDLQR